MSIITVNLVLPGLLTAIEAAGWSSAYLKKFRKKAQCKTNFATSTDQQLLTLFGLKNTGIAALTALADGLPIKEDDYWLRADPVHLRVDWMHVFMLGNQHLQLNKDELTFLLNFLNAHLKNENLQLLATNPLRWYLKITEIPQFISYNPNEIIGKSIADYLPQNAEQARWLKLFTEIQMLLFESSINIDRQKNNQPSIDALWLWGQGQLPKINNQISPIKIMTDDALTQGLALLHKLNAQLFDISNIENFLDADCNEYLICTRRYAAIEQVSAGELDFSWLELIMRMRSKKKIAEIHLYSGDGCCYSW